MIQQGFYIKRHIPEPWWFMVYYNVASSDDRKKVFGALLSSGSSTEAANRAISVLTIPNTAYIFSDTKHNASIIALSAVTSKIEFLNSVTHELQHATAHVCDTFSIPLNSEQAGYIQGEIGEQLYEGVALSICPKCNCKNH